MHQTERKQRYVEGLLEWMAGEPGRCERCGMDTRKFESLGNGLQYRSRLRLYTPSDDAADQALPGETEGETIDRLMQAISDAQHAGTFAPTVEELVCRGCAMSFLARYLEMALALGGDPNKLRFQTVPQDSGKRWGYVALLMEAEPGADGGWHRYFTYQVEPATPETLRALIQASPAWFNAMGTAAALN